MAEIIELSEERRDVYMARRIFKKREKTGYPPMSPEEEQLLKAVFDGYPKDRLARLDRIVELAEDKNYR
jgi:hypothetical protein